MKQRLPSRPSLEHLKAQAKDLLSAAKRGEPTALARIRASLPSTPPNLALHDAQSVIAREYGLDSWRALRERVEAENGYRSLVEPVVKLVIPQAIIDAAFQGKGDAVNRLDAIPPALPLLALRNHFITVGAVAPLSVQRPETLSAIAEAEKGDRLLAIFAQRDPLTEDPAEGDLHSIGCAARIVRRTQGASALDGWLLVQGLAWIELESLERRADHLVARVSPFAVEQDATPRANELRTVVLAAAGKLRLPDVVLRQIEGMTPLEMADAAVANARCSVAAKAEYASERRLSARIARAIALIDGEGGPEESENKR